MKVRDILEYMSHDALVRLCQLKDLPARSDNDRRSRLSRSYRGNISALLVDLRRFDLMDFLRQVASIKNLNDMHTDDMRKFILNLIKDEDEDEDEDEYEDEDEDEYEDEDEGIESILNFLAQRSSSWSPAFPIVQVMTIFGLREPQRLSQKQFSILIKTLKINKIEAAAPNNFKIYKEADDSPGVNSFIVIRFCDAGLPKKSSSVVAKQSSIVEVDSNKSSRLVGGKNQEIIKIMEQKAKNETEVEHHFVVPLLRLLGYQSEDFSMRHKVYVKEGVEKRAKFADVVVFDGSDRSDAASLLVIEAKSPKLTIKSEHAHQALFYSISLHAPYAIVTNGLELVVYMGALPQLRLEVRNLANKWSELRAVLERSVVVSRKKELQRIAEDL